MANTRSALIQKLLAESLAGTKRRHVTTGGALGTIGGKLALAAALKGEQKKELGREKDAASAIVDELSAPEEKAVDISLDDVLGGEPTEIKRAADPLIERGQAGEALHRRRGILESLAGTQGGRQALTGLNAAVVQDALLGERNFQRDLKLKNAGKAVPVRTQKIASLVETGTPSSAGFDFQNNERPFAFAEEIVDGHVKATTSPDEFGFLTMSNVNTGQTERMNVRDAQAAGFDIPQGTTVKPDSNTPFGMPSEFTRVPVAKWNITPGVAASEVATTQGHTRKVDQALLLADNINKKTMEDASGFANITQRFAERGVQFFGNPSFVGADERTARDNIKRWNQMAKPGFMNNPRAPITEQQLIDSNILPDPDSFTTAPAQSALRFSGAVQALAQIREGNQAFVEGRQPNIIPRQPTGFENDPIPMPEGMDHEEIAKMLPAGTWLVGPDGQRFEVQDR